MRACRASSLLTGAITGAGTRAAWMKCLNLLQARLDERTPAEGQRDARDAAHACHSGNLDVVHRIAPGSPDRRGPPLNSTVASTATHSRNTLMLMRSHSPIHGVGRFAWTRGASQKVNAPNATRTTTLAMEYTRKRFPNAVAAAPIATNMSRTVALARARCMVSLSVPPPAA